MSNALLPPPPPPSPPPLPSDPGNQKIIPLRNKKKPVRGYFYCVPYSEVISIISFTQSISVVMKQLNEFKLNMMQPS